jgi:hypothetical protein
LPVRDGRVTVIGMRPLLATAALVAALGAAGPARGATTTDPISILDQTDGITSKRVTTVALYCHKLPCAGSVKLGTSSDLKFGSATFSIPASTTGKVPVKISKAGFALIKGAPSRKLKVTLTVKLASGQVFTHLITLRA